MRPAGAPGSACSSLVVKKAACCEGVPKPFGMADECAVGGGVDDEHPAAMPAVHMKAARIARLRKNAICHTLSM